MSIIAQAGGATAPDLHRALCVTGPFTEVSPVMFAQLLRDLGAARILEQSDDGTLLLGPLGEKLVNHYSFFAAFTTPEEFRVVTSGKPLGTLPVNNALMEDDYLIFAGRRWRVIAVHDRERLIEVVPAPGGSVPSFCGGGGHVHDRVREEMVAVYESTAPVPFLDETAGGLLEEGRMHFRTLGLDVVSLVEAGDGVVVFPWAGDRVLNTLIALFAAHGIRGSITGIALDLWNTTRQRVMDALRLQAGAPLPDPAALAERVDNKVQEKYHEYLSDPLLAADYASGYLDVPGAYRVIRRLVGEE
jgi:ATP-dependent Lhr-like helicase